MLSKWEKEHRKWVAKFNKEWNEGLKEMAAMPGNYCAGCGKRCQDSELKRLRNSKNKDLYCPKCLSSKIKHPPVEDWNEKDLSDLLSRLHWDEDLGFHGRVADALRKLNPFNKVLQDNWWCLGNPWFDWITQDMNKKDKEKQKRLEKEREEDFKRRQAEAEGNYIHTFP